MGQSSSPGSEIKNVNFKKRTKKDIIKKKTGYSKHAIKILFFVFSEKKTVKIQKKWLFFIEPTVKQCK